MKSTALRHLLFWAIFVHTIATAAPTEEQYNSINDLAAAGEMAKAKERLDLFLGLYPEDATLLEMQEVLEQSRKDGKQEPPSDEKSNLLSNKDRLEIETVIRMSERIAAIKSDRVQREKANELLAMQIPEKATISENPAWLAYWSARASTALLIGHAEHAWTAAGELKRLDAIESEHESIRNVLVALNSQGFLGEERGQPHARSVTIKGQVKEARLSLLIGDEIPLKDLVEAAGGITRLANQRRIKIERLAEDGAKELIELDYREDSTKSFKLKPGDVVTVPERLI